MLWHRRGSSESGGDPTLSTLDNEWLRQLRDLGLDAATVLKVLGQHGPRAKGVLKDETNLGRWRAHVALTKLEALKLVAWEEDGPAKRYSLTDVGRRAYVLLTQDPQIEEVPRA